MNSLTRKFSRFIILLVVEFASLEAENGLGFKNLIMTLSKLLNFEEMKNNLSLVVTKISDDEQKEDVEEGTIFENMLENLSENCISRQYIELFTSSEMKKKITTFPKIRNIIN